MARKRWQGTTTQRGYGSHHQAERARRIAAWRPGDRCARCHQLLDGIPAHMDLGHIDGTAKTQYSPGLEHRTCNRAAGARLKNQRRRRTAVTTPQVAWLPSRDW